MLFVEVPLHTPELFVNAPDQLHVTALNGTGHPPDGWNIINISYDPDAETVASTARASLGLPAFNKATAASSLSVVSVVIWAKALPKAVSPKARPKMRNSLGFIRGKIDVVIIACFPFYRFHT